MGSLGQTLSFCFTAVINIYSKLRRVYRQDSSLKFFHLSNDNEKRKRDDTGNMNELPWQQQVSLGVPQSNSCLEPCYPWHTVGQRSVDRTRAEEGATPRCLMPSLPLQKLQLFDQRSNRVQRQQLFFPFLYGVESSFFPLLTAPSLRRSPLRIHEQHPHKPSWRLLFMPKPSDDPSS